MKIIEIGTRGPLTMPWEEPQGFPSFLEQSALRSKTPRQSGVRCGSKRTEAGTFGLSQIDSRPLFEQREREWSMPERTPRRLRVGIRERGPPPEVLIQ